MTAKVLRERHSDTAAQLVKDFFHYYSLFDFENAIALDPAYDVNVKKMTIFGVVEPVTIVTEIDKKTMENFVKCIRKANQKMGKMTDENANRIFEALINSQPGPQRVFIVKRIEDEHPMKRNILMTGAELGDEDVLVKIICEDVTSLQIGQLGFLVHKMSRYQVSFFNKRFYYFKFQTKMNLK